MKIGLDFDGVIADCRRLKSYAAEKLYNKWIPPNHFCKEHIIRWGILTAEQYGNLQEAAYGTREIGLHMHPVPGAIRGIRALISEGHTLQVITSRSGKKVDIAREWSEQRGLDIRFTGVGKETKVKAAANLDVFVDDDLSKLKPLIGIVPNLYLFSWPYNRGDIITKPIRKVVAWREICSVVRTL